MTPLPFPLDVLMIKVILYKQCSGTRKKGLRRVYLWNEFRGKNKTVILLETRSKRICEPRKGFILIINKWTIKVGLAHTNYLQEN